MARTAHTPFEHIRKMARLFRRVIFAGDERVFERYAPPRFCEIVAARGKQLCDRVFLVDWHEGASGCVIGGVQ